MTFTPIETQDDFDKAVAERLKRKDAAVRAEYADYDANKAKADKLDALTKGGKLDVEAELKRLGELDEAAEKGKATELREKVAKEAGVPAELIFGGNEEELKASAEALAKFAKPNPAPTVPAAGEHSGATKAPQSSLKSFVAELIPTE